MTTALPGPVLLVCADAEQSFQILEKLHEQGFTVVGPAPTAGLALTLTAQTMACTAIIAGQTAGRRGATELAEELARTWGVECFVMADDDVEEPLRDASGRGPMAILRRALGTASLRRATAH